MKKYNLFFFLLVFVLQMAAQDFESKADEYLNVLVSQQFKKDESGKIDRLLLHQGGQKLPGKKIK